jgi:aspartate/methionine/tyrosine aminotransferase
MSGGHFLFLPPLSPATAEGRNQMTAADVAEAPATPLPTHYLDAISLGKIVQIREQLLKAQANGVRVFRFESGDPSFSVAQPVLDAIGAAAKAGKTHYIPNNGIPQLRDALAAKVRDRNGLDDVSAEDIFVTNGAMHALFVTFGALLVPGDEVILPDPMWTEVVENIRMAGGVPVAVELSAEDDFEYRTDRIESAITPRTRAIFLNTPHNPTGAMLSRDRLLEIVALARANNLWIISDEAYEDILYEPWTHTSIGSIAGDYADRVISIFSFSKSHAMSGLRVGYIVTTSPTLHDRIRGFVHLPRVAPSMPGPSWISRRTLGLASPMRLRCRRSSPQPELGARPEMRSVTPARTLYGSPSAAIPRWFARGVCCSAPR